MTHTVSVTRLLDTAGATPVRSGVIIDRLINGHRKYVDAGLDLSPATTEGPVRTAREHVDAAAAMWEPDRTPILTARHVILGLALEDDVAWPLLRSGIIASMLERWQPGAGTADEPHRLVWDLLSTAGSRACEERPLLAAAFGAPAEWQTTDLPGRPSAVCWSPPGDRIAVLIGTVLYEVGPDRPPRRLRDVEGDVLAIAWGHDGPVLLANVAGETQLIRTGERYALAGTALSGRLSADATCAWVQNGHGVHTWPTPGGPAHEDLAPGEAVLAVGTTGRHGVVTSGPGITVASTEKAPPGPELPRPAGPVALAWLSKQHAVVTATLPGVTVATPEGLVLARLATGTGRTTALATDASGRRLAVTDDHGVGVWTLSKRRPVTSAVPGFHSDFSGGDDLLDADRDARAIAALIASQDLQPPLTIGLFGAWGSGKSFLLGRIERMVAQFAAAGPGSGYLGNVRVVTFNAWHYAETNLWASLVDVVLRAIGTPRSRPAVGTTDAAERAAADAEAAALDAARQTGAAGRELRNIQRRRDRRSRPVLALGGIALVLFAVAAVSILLGGRILGIIATVTAGVSVIAGFVARVRVTTGQVRDLTGAGAGVIQRLFRRPGDDEVTVAARRLGELTAAQDAAQAEAERLRGRARAAAEERALGDVLDDLTEVTEYREQLGLVARTRERFRAVDEAVALARSAPAAGTLDRVVIVIDDLDRCPAEKVVTVLEAVHLLFEFPMFVVVLAVDTRWLDQSLRIRYRQLLGEPGTAAPSDYLEKIIQLPVQLLPLDDAMVGKLITGITGVTPGRPGHPGTAPEAPAGRPDVVAPIDRAGPFSAERPRTARPVLAEPLTISEADAVALAEVAPLIGRTPRTVKRFVNTYRLIKARVTDPDGFDHADERGLGDHEAVAFLLAVLVGHPAAAPELFAALAGADRGDTLVATAGEGPIGDWVKRHPRFADAPARYFGRWAEEVGRFAFTPVN